VSYKLSQLDYASLLAQPDQQAFLSALSTKLATNFSTLLTQLSVTMGLPTVPNSAEPTLTQVPLTSTNPAQTQPESIEYMRLDLGDYMTCCQRYISTANVASADAVAAWFMNVHDLYFDPTKLTLSSITQDPSRSDRQLMTVSVDPTNYVWVGSVTLYVVVANHLALLTTPGIAKGLIQSDVMAPA
jgi:hypothetical protein